MCVLCVCGLQEAAPLTFLVRYTQLVLRVAIPRVRAEECHVRGEDDAASAVLKVEGRLILVDDGGRPSVVQLAAPGVSERWRDRVSENGMQWALAIQQSRYVPRVRSIRARHPRLRLVIYSIKLPDQHPCGRQLPSIRAAAI